MKGLKVRTESFEVEENIRKYRRKQRTFVAFMSVINILIIAFLIMYNNAKQRALIGLVYLYDNNAATNLIDKMMHLNINSITYKSGMKAMIESGYTAKGYWYLSRINKDFLINIVALVIPVLIMIYGFIMCYRIGKRDFLGTSKEVFNDNEKLRLKLLKESEYNKQQYKKMYEFVENIAHQIKTPLSVMIIKLEMIEDFVREEEQPKSINLEKVIKDCTNNAFKIKNFIKKLLDISRIESGKIVFNSEKVIIDYMIEESVAGAVLDTSKVIIDYGNEDADRIMFADEGWMVEAFINIISNSYDYINEKEEGCVHIDISSNKEVCVIKIADNGSGINKEDISSIFDRFAGNRSQNEFHTGIGLNLSKLIIEAHHGSIRAANSEKYGGAEFSIILPLYKMKEKL